MANRTNKQTAKQAFVNLVRASVGPGMLALPHAFLHAGYALGLCTLGLLTIVIMFNMLQLVECRHFLNRDNHSKRLSRSKARGQSAESTHEVNIQTTYPSEVMLVGRPVSGDAVMTMITHKSEIRTFGDMGLAVFGKTGKLCIEAVLVLLELGICTVYFSFLVSSIKFKAVQIFCVLQCY
jgi:amino acid permease